MRVRMWWVWVGAGVSCACLAASLCGQDAKKATAPCDWPQWRGPNRDGSSPETDWTYRWPDRGPRELWRVTLAPGYSTVSVRNGLLYTNGGTFKDEVVYCLSARNGSEVWKFQFPLTEVSGKKWAAGAFTTPAVDGKLVFAQSMSGYVAALDADSGKIVWGRDLVKEAGKEAPNYGCSSSPLVEGGLVIVSGAVGIEKTTGRIVWKSEKVPAYHPSPVVMTVGKERGVVFVSDRFVCVKAASGELLWEIPRGHANFFIDPVVSGDRILFWNSLYRIEDGKPSPVYCTSYSPDDGSLYSTPIVWRDHVYKLSSLLVCRELSTGKVKWTKEGVAGTMILADAKLIILTKDGHLVVAEASKEAYKELARFRVFKEEGLLRALGVWSAPVLSDGRLYLRNYGELVCLDLRKSQQVAGSKSAR